MSNTTKVALLLAGTGAVAVTVYAMKDDIIGAAKNHLPGFSIVEKIGQTFRGGQ